MKIKVEDYPKLVEQRGKRAFAAVKRGLLAGAMRCIQELQRSTEQAPPASPGGKIGAVNTGEYRRRWKAAPTDKGARVYNDSVQAGPIEKGRRPGTMPPLDAIEKWALRRLHLTPKEAKKAAYPIAKAIKARGLMPRRVLTNAVTQARMKKIVHEEVQREVTKELSK